MNHNNYSQRYAPLAIWTVLCGIYFATLLFGLERIPSSDFSGQFHSFALFQSRELAEGRFPMWSPGSFAGFPYVADTQAANFYPPRLILILLTLPWGFSYYALQLEAIVHIWLAGLFTYGLVYSITQKRWPALLGCVAFGFSGYLTSYPILQLAILETIVWAPLFMLLVRKGTVAKNPIPWFVSAGLVLGVSALAGHPQTFLHVAYMGAAYYLFLTVTKSWHWRWIMGLGGLIGLSSLGFSAVVWLPSLQLARLTTRSAVDYEFVATGLPMLDYTQIFIPSSLSLWPPQYVGIVTIMLALAAWWNRRLDWQSEVSFWAATAITTAWLALGDSGIVFRLVYLLAPGFQLFRQQERLMGLFSLSLAILAGQGLALWLKMTVSMQRERLWQMTTVMGMSLLITAFILQTASSITYEGWTTVWVRQLAFLVLASILLWSLYRFQTRLRTLAICIIVLLAVDLYLVGVNSLDRQPGSPSIYWPVPDWLEQLQAEDPGRIDTGFHFYANVGEIYNLENTSGISPLKLRWVADFERLPTVRRWQLLNVTHIVSASPPSEANLTPLTEVREPLVPDHGINATLYRFEDSLPRAWMSYQPVFVTGADEALAILHDQAFDPSTQVVVDTISTNIEAFQQIITAATPPVITISRPNSSRLQLEVETEQPGILVISEWNYPGWRATVNGGSTPILSVNYALQGLQLPAGHHTITLRFQPATVIVGLFISLITLFASGLVARRWQTAVSKSPIRKKSANRFPLINSHAKRLSTITVNYRYYAIALILLGFALRIFLLGEQELRGDEAFSYLFARQPVNQIIPTLLSEGDPHSPLHYLLLHGWMRLAGSTEFAMRYISLIPSLLLVPLMMRLGAELWDKRLGLIAAGLFTISQSLIWLAQDTRNQYTLALFFGAISTVVLIRASRNKWSTLKKQDWSLWTLYIVSTALTVYSHYYGIFPLIAHGLYLWFSPGKRPYLPVWLISSFAAGLLFLPWTLVSWRGLVGAGQLSDPAQPELAHYLTVVGLEMVTGPAFSSWIGRWLFLICVFLSIYGSLYLAKRAPGWNALLVSWLLITALGVYLVQFQRATFNPFYISIASPAWWLLLSSGLYALWQKQDLWRLAAPIGLSAIIVTSGIALFNYYTKPEYRRSIGYRDIAAHLEAEAKPDDVFVAHFPDPSLDYYLRDLPLPRRMIPVRMNAPANETEHSLAELAATFERIWFVPAHFSVWDPENIAFRWLNYHNLKEWELDYYRLSLFGYRPQHALSKSVAPIGLETETVGRIRLQSAFISVNGSPVNVGDTLEIKSGDAINVTLIWENFSPVPERYAVFVHLLGEDGGLIAQHDGVPLFGTRPTDTWLPGEQLVDWHEIVVSDAGRVENGTIMVGLYHQQTLDRQRFVGIGDAYQLRSVRFVD